MLMSYSISVIIPNYNGQNLLKKNLPRVFKSFSSYKEGFVEIIVADDCSTDESISILEKLKIKMHASYPNIKLKILKNSRNLGFSSNVNSGVRKSSGDILILLNTDVIPRNDFLMPLIKHFEDKSIFAVACMDESLEGSKSVFRGRGVGSWTRGFLIHSRGDIDKKDTLWVSGGSGAFRRTFWERLGGFDELYNPFYWEDIDLSYRALKSGYKIVFEPRSIVIHEHEKGAIKSKYSLLKIKAIAYRNQFIFVWKNATDLNLQFLHLFWLPYYLIKALIRGDYIFFTSFFLAFLRLPRILTSSFRAQKYFTKSDKEVIGGLGQ